MQLAIASKGGNHLLVGFDLTFSLVAEHLFHEVELLHEALHAGVLDEVGVGGLPLHLVLVDGLHCCLLERVEQQLHTHTHTHRVQLRQGVREGRTAMQDRTGQWEGRGGELEGLELHWLSRIMHNNTLR